MSENIPSDDNSDNLPPISEVSLSQGSDYSLPAPQIEGYQILEKLGEAGQGQVWAAIQLSTNRKVALKVPRFYGFGSKKAFLRFEREVQVAARLKHPNLVRIHDSGVHKGLYYYAMEHIEGVHLDKYVKDHKLSEIDILKLMHKICLAVQYAHQNAVIHRDLKPSNIIVSADGEPHIVDFGLAKGLLEDDIALTVTQDTEVAGTPAFMSPEQAAGKNQVDVRTDIYSLGAILYYLLTDQYPHDLTGTRQAILKTITEEEIRYPRDIRQCIDKEIVYILLKALAKDLEYRYSSAGEFAQDIANFLTGDPLIAGPESAVYRFKKFIKKRIALTVAVGSVAAVLVLGVIVSTTLFIQARKSAEENRKSLYLNQITLVASECINENSINARNILQDSPEDLRHWEYNYLNRIIDQSQITIQGHQGDVRSVVFTPDGKRIVSGGYDGTIRVWDVYTGTELIKIDAYNSWITDIRISPNGKQLVSSSESKTVKLWDLENGNLIRTLNGHTKRVNSVDYSPDGSRVVSGSIDSTVRVWDVNTGNEILLLSIPKRAIASVVFSSDGDNIIATTSTGGDGNRFIKIWDSTTGALLIEKDGSNFAPFWIAHFWDMELDSNRKEILTANWGQACTWNIETLELKTFIPQTHRFGSRTATFSPDGKHILTGGVTGTLKIWQRDGGLMVRTLHGHQGSVSSVAYNPTGTQIVSGSQDGTIKVWDATNNRVINIVPNAHPHTPVRSVSFNHNGTQLVTGGEDNVVRIWDTRKWKQLFALPGHSASITSVSFSPDGKRLISGSQDSSIRLWQIDSYYPIALKVLSKHSDCVNSITYSPDGRYFASGGKDKIINIWDSETGSLIETFKGHSLSVNSICYTPDGRHLVSGSSDKTVRIWDVNKKRLLKELKNHKDPVTCVTISPQGHLIVSGDESGNIILWNKDEGRQLLSMKGHLDRVTDVMFSADGKRIFSSSLDDTIRIWSPETDKCVLMLDPFYRGGVQSIAFSPDEETLVAGSNWNGDMIVISLNYSNEYLELKKSESQIDYYKYMGSLHSNLGHYEKTVELFKMIIQLNPQNVEGNRNLMKTYDEFTNTDIISSEEILRICEDTNWNDWFYLGVLASKYSKKDDFTNAVKWQQKAIVCLPQDIHPSWKTIYNSILKAYQARQPYIGNKLWSFDEGELIAKWDFNNIEGKTVLDSSGNELHGKLMGNATIINDPQRGKVLSLDGNNSYMECGNDWRFDISGSITISIWTKVIQFNKYFQFLVTKGDSSWRICRNEDKDALHFACSGTLTRANDWFINSSRNVNDGQWHHISGVYDGERFFLYVDGRLDISESASGSIEINNYPVRIGSNAQVQGKDWNGLIDDVSIYSYALSANEISEIYKQMSTKK